MGDYATTTSISNLLPNYLKGNTTSSDTAGVAVFDAHVTRAEALVNSQLGTRYSLPFTTVPPICRTLTEDIACYYAMRGAFNQDGRTKNPYLDEYKTAMDMLAALGKGEAALVLTDGSQVPAMSADRFKSSTKDFVPVFGLDSASSWRRDPDEERAKIAERLEQ